MPPLVLSSRIQRLDRIRGSVVPIHGERSENEVFAEIQSALEQVPA